MRLLFAGVATHPTWGGGEPRIAHDLVHQLEDHGWEVHTVCFRRDEYPMSYPCFFNPADIDPVYFVRYIRALKRLKPDVVVAWYDYDSTLCRAAMSQHIPTICAAHIYWPICPLLTLYFNGPCLGPSGRKCANHFWQMAESEASGLSLPLVYLLQGRISELALARISEFALARRKETLKGVDAIVVPSKFVKDKLVSHGLNNVVLIHNGVDIRFFSPRQPSDGEKLILYLGASSKEYKGFRHFVKAANTLKRRHKSLRFAATGLTTNSTNHNAVEGVGYLPRVDMIETLAESYLVVVPSLWEEPFGLAAVEAMAMGKPVVGYASGAIPEIVTHRVTGLLAPPGNVGLLTQHIEDLILDERLAISMGTTGRKIAENEFSLERASGSYMKLIEQVADR